MVQESALGRVKAPGLRFPQVGPMLLIRTHFGNLGRGSFDAAQGQLLKHFGYILLAIGLSCFAVPSSIAALNYPNFNDNPYLTPRLQATIAPYLLPLDHPMKASLDSIFSRSRVIENERSLIDAGFSIIAGPMHLSFIIVARHPEIPGYVFKIYLDSEKRCRKEIPHWQWLARRCAGAFGIRQIIERKKIHYFSVPDKWLYLLPVYPYSTATSPQPVILMETDMEPESYEVTQQMWKTAITHKHLDELYAILKHGHGGNGTIFLYENIPFTKKGKFAFTDTEDPRAQLELKHIKKYLSKDMQRYWESLINPSPEVGNK